MLIEKDVAVGSQFHSSSPLTRRILMRAYFGAETETKLPDRLVALGHATVFGVDPTANNDHAIAMVKW